MIVIIYKAGHTKCQISTFPATIIVLVKTTTPTTTLATELPKVLTGLILNAC